MHRCLVYAVQQIIAQELEVERLKRASISMGLGQINSESATSSKNFVSTEKVHDKSSNDSNKQSGKNKAPLKEIVSFCMRVCFFLYII